MQIFYIGVQFGLHYMHHNNQVKQMTETKHKEHITSEDFGIPADFADRAENYAAWRVQALSEQLAESKAEVTRLEPLQFRQAPCHKFCEATAFEIEIRNLKKQLSEAQALIEASRKQEPVAYEEFSINFSIGTRLTYNATPYFASDVASRPLYSAPVVAPDVLKELWWIRAIFAKDLKTGGVFLQNIHGKEVSKWIDRVDALGGAA